MIRSRTTAFSVLVFVALGVAALAPTDSLAAEERTEPDVMITLTIARGEGAEATSRTFQAIARPGRSGQARVGWRVPIPRSAPAGAGEVDDGGQQGIAYSYQENGFSGEFNVSVGADGAILVRGSIEDSAVVAAGSGGEGSPPTVSMLAQRFETLLRDGVAQTILAGEQPGLGKVSIEISATVLR